MGLLGKVVGNYAASRITVVMAPGGLTLCSLRSSRPSDAATGAFSVSNDRTTHGPLMRSYCAASTGLLTELLRRLHERTNAKACT